MKREYKKGRRQGKGKESGRLSRGMTKVMSLPRYPIYKEGYGEDREGLGRMTKVMDRPARPGEGG